MQKKDTVRFTGQRTNGTAPGPLELVRRAACTYPDFFHPALTKIEKLDESSISDLVNRVPDDWMTPSAREFSVALMRYNFEQLQEFIR